MSTAAVIAGRAALDRRLCVSRRSSARVASVLGVGRYLPAEIVSNAPIAARLGVDEEWIVRRTGIRCRHRAAGDERLSELAARAGARALAAAGVEPGALDLVLVATMSQDELTPNSAPLVAHALGARRAGAVDVGAACTGWLSGLALGAACVESGRAGHVLVIGAETLTRLTDADDRDTAALFGDGAAAVVLGPADHGGIGAVTLHADGAYGETIVATHAGRAIRMDGHATFLQAVRRLSECTEAAVARAGLALADIDLFVYHQGNGRVLGAVARRLGLPAHRLADYIAETGNTGAASVPLALARADEDGRLHQGDRVLVAAIGAGFTWGAGVLEWG